MLRATRLARLARPRLLSPLASAARDLSTASSPGFFELRTDRVLPGALDSYLREQKRTAAARQKIFPGWLGIWKTSLGAECHTVHHLYHWSSYSQRDQTRYEAFDEPEQGQDVMVSASSVLPLPSLRPMLQSSHSAAFVEATATLQGCGLPGALAFEPAAAADAGERVAWELRTYQLRLGYDAVPQFLELYADGLADKLKADDSGASSLCTLLYSDCGPLNVVHELWRHESLERAQASRAASRKAAKWRSAIGEIAKMATSFETSYLIPLARSPWQ